MEAVAARQGEDAVTALLKFESCMAANEAMAASEGSSAVALGDGGEPAGATLGL